MVEMKNDDEWFLYYEGINCYSEKENLFIEDYFQFQEELKKKLFPDASGQTNNTA